VPQFHALDSLPIHPQPQEYNLLSESGYACFLIAHFIKKKREMDRHSVGLTTHEVISFDAARYLFFWSQPPLL
jgi:hypothetical protein